MAKFFLGIDLGGTNVKAGVTTAEGRLLADVSLPTTDAAGRRTVDGVVAQMLEAGRQAAAKAGVSVRQLAAVGVLSPGQASLSRGIVLRSANFPEWKNVPLCARISKGFGLRAVLENDANAAAYGEYWVGAGKQRRVKSLFIITLGTGVGGGYVENGRVLRGAFDFATEIGHMIVVPGGNACGCGQHGCLETYSSAFRTGQRATLQLKASPALRKRSSLGKVLRANGEVTARDVADHALKGDAFASGVWDETCRYIAIGCLNAARMFDPEMIVLAGGMVKSGRHLLDPVRAHLRKLWWKMTPIELTLALARLGNDAGIIGGAGVAKAALECGEMAPIGR